MQRRNFNQAGAGALGLLMADGQARALSLGDLTPAEAGNGLKTALEKDVLTAVDFLGKPDGFLGNPKVRIPVPGYLEDASRLLKNFGQCRRIDELATALNRTAESAVPMGKDLLVGAVRERSAPAAPFCRRCLAR